MTSISLRIDELEEQVDDLKDHLKAIKELVAKQAEDEGLWFDAKYAPTAYLQESLRALHKAVEND